jgi:hypothetical protein
MILGFGPTGSFAGGPVISDDEIGIRFVETRPQLPDRSTFLASQSDTIWVGFLPTSSDPNKVGIGGVWDFDTDVAGTDSSQFWQFFLTDWFLSASRLPTPGERLFWYLDHGNEANIGNTNLWIDRESRGVSYRRTGITGYWHVDDMGGVSTPLSGSSSAWCGLRGPGDFTIVDEVTGNPLNGDLVHKWAGVGAPVSGAWPGYGNQIDQILYRDIDVAGDGTDVLSFRFRTDMSPTNPADQNGTAWFNPDPTTMANFVLDPIDSFMVWVGLPQETDVYDPNKRWLSEVIDFDSANQPAKLFATHGRAPLLGADSTVNVILPSLGGATTYRIAYQVKTNRLYSDEGYAQNGFNSIDGAALVDDVTLNGGSIGDFELQLAIRPRLLLNGDGTTTENSPRDYWITTGKPPAGYGHVHNVFDLPYDDPCGSLGSPDRLCDLMDNTINLSDHDDDDHAFFRESRVLAESPTIDLSAGSALRAAGVGTTHDRLRIEYQIFTGHMEFPVEAVLYTVGVRYHGPSFLQQAGEPVPGWSDWIYYSNYANKDPECKIVNTGLDLDAIIPPPSQLDSIRIFVSTLTVCAAFGIPPQCGKPEGGYFDNIRVCFVSDEGHPLSTDSWDLLQDTFPFNEDITPGTASFDTSTALLKCGGDARGVGIIMGDTLTATAPFATNTRVDFVFRILPGPGNYTDSGITLSPLIVKDPSRDFWGTYLLDNGPFGTPGGHEAGVWDPSVWNSARMDSMDSRNVSPLVARVLGVPAKDRWQATLHEMDPNYTALGIPRNICFLVDPNGNPDSHNVCCSPERCEAAPFFDLWPPLAYPPGAQTTTIEATKILPDGWFSPGTHVEYFLRRSDAPDGLTGVVLTPDTTRADMQPAIGPEPHQDRFRFLEFGVLPDLWKDVSFGGDGLACMLVVDVGDGRGQESAIIGALDSLGYGENKGAGRGWKEVDPVHPNPNDPSGFVAQNLGQKGLAFDWMDCNACDSASPARPGCRLAVAPPELADRQCKVGPTPAMLKTYYNTILWMSADLSTAALHDGESALEPANDVALIQDFLDTSDGGSERSIWIAGDDAANDLANSAGNGPTLLNGYFAAVFEANDYRVAAGNRTTPIVYDPLIPEFHNSRQYGYDNSCLYFPDVISVNGAVAGGQLAAKYEDITHRGLPINPGEFGAAVYRPADDISRYYTTLITGHQLPHLRGHGAANSVTDFGRIAFLDDAMQAFGLFCPRGPVIAVGDVTGLDGAQLNFVRGAFPNPSVTGESRVQFTVAQAGEVTIRFYNVAGRLVHKATMIVENAGPAEYRWDGSTSTEIRVSPGVYFYRLAAPGIEFRNNSQRMVLLGGVGH